MAQEDDRNNDQHDDPSDDRGDDETPWTRQLLVGAGALVAVALVIGAVVSVVALGAAKVSGLGDTSPSASARPSLYMPSGRPTTRLDTYPAPSGISSPTTPGATATTPAAKPKATPKPRITLQAFPQQVGANQRITLSGGYARGEGAKLLVQRFEAGAWADFPVDATVTGQLFSTYITTGRTGVNRIRMLDPTTGRTSNPVRVTVR